jgi:prolyl oligopeptidase
MKKTIKTIIIFSMLTNIVMAQKINYPKTEKKIVKDVYFETEINDPYRWLEDDRAKETEAWVSNQNQVTFSYLKQIPYVDKIKQRMEKLWNFERFSAPFKEGNNTYYYKNDGLQNQSVLYRKNENGTDEVFLDPNTFSKDGTTSLSNVSFTKDGSMAAYSISEAGSDWNKIFIIDVASKKIVENALIDVKFSGISWQNNNGFYYSKYEKPTGSELSAKTDQHKLYFHQLGTAQSQDKVVFGNQVKRRYVSGSVTEDQNYLIVSAANSTSGNELYIKDLSKENSEFITIINNFDHSNYLIENKGSLFFMQTNKNAPNQKLISFNLDKYESENWKTIIPEQKEVLSLSTGSGFFFAEYMKDAISVVKQLDYEGKLIREVKLPGLGTVGGFGGKINDKTLYYSFTNYTTPSSIYTFEPVTGESKSYFSPKLGFNTSLYETIQVFYTSKDGTKVPMIISYKKGLKLDGKNPTMLYGYGGFNISLTPSFNVANAVWMENGGIYAVPNIRGGGEYGRKWHDAGTKMEKQNVFDDFIAAADYLIKQKYTSKDFLAIRGGSNGGLLVGACMTQRPDLFKVALPAVGVLDMLRYHTFTAGAGWGYDYGTSEESKEMFDYLKKYSPVHNVKKQKYPATLVTTADHDDRVVPAHSFKFAAHLQENQTGNNPVLIRIDVNAGHGAGKPISKTIEEAADIQAFTLYNFGIKNLKLK